MKYIQPVLKPAVQQSVSGGATALRYRGQELTLQLDETRLFDRMRRTLTSPRTLAVSSYLDATQSDVEWLLTQLDHAHMLVEGANWSTVPGLLSGEQAFWLLEADACHLKFGDTDASLRHDLEALIARGEVRQEVAQGWLVELGYLLRQVPQELSLAVSSAQDEDLREQYVEFFKEECDHGRMMYDKLKDWIAPEHLLKMRPLPSTLGVLNMYRSLASEGPLAYAVALMHDESTLLDPMLTKDSDPYAGLRKYYQVPAPVVDIFEWHAHLDRGCEHGFFPLEIFRRFRWVETRTVDLLRQRMLSLFETHALWRRELVNYFSTYSLAERIPR